MRAKKSPRYARIVSLLLCLALAATLIPSMPFTLGEESGVTGGLSADGKTYYISTFNELMTAAGHSKTPAGNTIKYVLLNDIEISDREKATLQGLDIDHLTFGDEGHYFLGEFDGRGHTITGLDYANKIFKVATRTGLFSYVGHKDAAEALKYNTYIHDLTIEGANMHADYLSGIVAGEAYNTRFVNVNVVDSAMSVNPADNALLLITDGGVVGGAIAGYAKHCTFYNCGTRNTTVRTNSVSGVAALAGKPLYLGGLVGQADTFTQIEYCRVMGGAVKNRYESSVGALGGFTCYAGGLAGGLSGGTKVIDCFASCDVSFYAATYVGVGAGCSGHAGGLAGKTDKDGNGGVTIRRCHYAGGTISSYQYNTLLLMIPVQIANDVNRSGLVDKCDYTTVDDSFFNYTDAIGPKNGKPANVLGDKKVADEYGPQPDERYMDREFWENRGYDFAGNIDRSTGSGTLGPHLTPQPYFNKWVMYYYDDPVLDADGNPTGTTVRRGYPVHGLSVAATFDFPGAGTVTLKPTLEDSLSQADGATTADPYRFAVLGFYPAEQTVTTYTDGTPTKGGVALSADMGEGYRVTDWYFLPSVAAAGLPSGQHVYFDRIFADDSRICDALNVESPGQRAVSYPHVAVADNQLYVARCQALVEFCGLDGVTLNKTSGASEGTPDLSDDWYYYGELLPAVTPTAAPPSEGAKLIGWTTTPDSGDATPGWEQINTTQLDALKSTGAFYTPDMPIVKTLTLYPVYANQLLNIHVEIEGYKGKSDPVTLEPDKTYRELVGQTYVTSEGDAITLGVKSFATATEADQPTADFPAGYRFLGWYEDGHCVSRERDYTLPATVDLNREHTYQARFEYRVDYWVNYINNDAAAGKYGTSTLYATRWELYNAPFTVLKAPDFHKNTFVLWWTEGPQTEDGTPPTPAEGYQGPITDPVTVYSYYTTSANLVTDTITVTSDFPHAAVMTVTNEDPIVITTKPDAHYNYIFSNLENSYGNGDFYELEVKETPLTDGVYRWESSTSNSAKVYTYTSHLDADVIFHDVSPNGSGLKATHTVTRRYEEKVLRPDPQFTEYYGTWDPSQHISTYKTPDGTDLNGHKSEVCPADPRYPGYYFVGWVDVDDPDTAAALDWIYDVSSYDQRDSLGLDGSGRCLTSDAERAKPYILTADDIVTRAMPNIYPVFAKYDVKTTTNVLMTVENVVQKPDDPGCALADDTAASTTATITAYNNVLVNPTKPDGDKYAVEAVTVSIDGGAPETIADHTVDAEGNWVVTYPVVPGKSYLFTAVYRPLVVVFHQDGNATTEVLVRNYGDAIGRPAPKDEGGVSEPVLPTVQDTSNELNHALFVGWTETRPDDPEARPYHFFPADPPGAENPRSSYAKAYAFGYWTPGQTEDTVVTHSMELWPVYAEYTVTVNSNIDNALKAEKPDIYPDDDALWAKVRSLQRESANTVSTTVKAAEVEGYKFVGWYTGVKPDETGEYTDFSAATAISEAEEYTLEGGEPFTAKLYTARYKAVYKVIYHNRGKYLSDPTKDPVIYTNYLYEGEDEDKSLNMKITEEVERPVLDADGKPVLNPDGTIKTQMENFTYHQPLDPVPYHMIYATMDEHESFGQWECHDPTAPVTEKDELVNVYPYSFDKLLPNNDPDLTLAQGLMARTGTNPREINLYPTVWRVTVRDSGNNDITSQVKVDIDMSGMDPESTSYENVKVYISFDPAEPYTQSKLSVQVQRTRWVETGDVNKPDIAIRGRNDVEVFLYSDATKTLQLAPSQMTHNLYSDGNEQNDGYAVFEFSDSPLRIVKTAPADRKGETFLFQVTNVANASQTWTVPVKCGDDVTSGGAVTGCTGSATIKLPTGKYSVTEAGNWTWLLKPTYSVRLWGTLQEAADAHKNVALGPLIPAAGAAAETGAETPVAAEVLCDNTYLPTGAQWSWKTDWVQNLFD